LTATEKKKTTLHYYSHKESRNGERMGVVDKRIIGSFGEKTRGGYKKGNKE
jgi:hypothetical protein